MGHSEIGGGKIAELHLISTGQQSTEALASIIEKVHTYVDVIHLREKLWTDREMIGAIELLTSRGVPKEKLIVNSRIDVAHVMKIRGVQLTHKSIGVSVVRNVYDHLKIGCSVHSVDEAIYASNNGADYLLYGHVFESDSKPGLKPKGLESLQRVVQSVPIPVIGIGGIMPGNTPDIIKSGAKGIAVLSGVLLSTDPLNTVIKYKETLQKVSEQESTC